MKTNVFGAGRLCHSFRQNKFSFLVALCIVLGGGCHESDLKSFVSDYEVQCMSKRVLFKKKKASNRCSQTFDAGKHGRNVCRDTSISILFLQSFSCNQLSVFFASVKPVPALICERY